MEPIVYRPYRGEADLPHIVALVQNELSEPYVVYTYRYFLHQWPHLSYLAYPPSTADSDSESPPPIGVIVCKQSMHRDRANRGYIAMLSVSKSWRKRGIASALVRHSIGAMKADGVEEVVLETEYDNAAALALYASLGFMREKRLYRFYLNGKDAFRLVLAVGTGAAPVRRPPRRTSASPRHTATARATRTRTARLRASCGCGARSRRCVRAAWSPSGPPTMTSASRGGERRRVCGSESSSLFFVPLGVPLRSVVFSFLLFSCPVSPLFPNTALSLLSSIQLLSTLRSVFLLAPRYSVFCTRIVAPLLQ
ncbi:hypothetical protein EVG20_g2192 [Dentipellis fragilis]|uniref:N-acetyltransferase domain-containing protein n=1 Tax=Dentipellis fragilis TaxID=205917 RepID=A0A4Y9ZAH4_9AGAM|nr:hypothetical protein EVG20_g2192 [Dentipellis fragilis]